MTFLTGGILPIRTCCESGGDGLAPPLVPEGHQVDGVLLPWPQTSLHKGSDSAGQLGGHPSVIVLQAARHKAMRENTLERRPCCYCIFSMNITLLLGFDVSEWKWEKNEPGSQLEKNPQKNAIICAVCYFCSFFRLCGRFSTLQPQNRVVLRKCATVLLWYVLGNILQQWQYAVHFQRPVTHPYGVPATSSCSCRVSVAHALPGNRRTSKPAPRS